MEDDTAGKATTEVRDKVLAAITESIPEATDVSPIDENEIGVRLNGTDFIVTVEEA